MIPTLYNIYAHIHSQEAEDRYGRGKYCAGKPGSFGRKRRAIENIHVLNYLIGREIDLKRGKLIAFFVYLEDIFDKFDKNENEGLR